MLALITAAVCWLTCHLPTACEDMLCTCFNPAWKPSIESLLERPGMDFWVFKTQVEADCLAYFKNPIEDNCLSVSRQPLLAKLEIWNFRQ